MRDQTPTAGKAAEETALAGKSLELSDKAEINLLQNENILGKRGKDVDLGKKDGIVLQDVNKVGKEKANVGNNAHEEKAIQNKEKIEEAQTEEENQ